MPQHGPSRSAVTFGVAVPAVATEALAGADWRVVAITVAFAFFARLPSWLMQMADAIEHIDLVVRRKRRRDRMSRRRSPH